MVRSGRAVYRLTCCPGRWIRFTKRGARQHQRVSEAIGRERPSVSVLIRNLEQNRPARIAQAHGLTIIGELTGIGPENILNAEEGFRIRW